MLFNYLLIKHIKGAHTHILKTRNIKKCRKLEIIKKSSGL